MHAAGVNAGGQIASVIAGGMILSLVPKVGNAVGAVMSVFTQF